jgi:mono/diheme cytochrome c family protein
MKATLLVSLIGATGFALAAQAKDVDTSKLPPASEQKDVTYAKDIKPVFDNSCVKCHGEQKPKARLRLDSLEGALKGSVDGKVIVPGDSAKSILVHCVGQIGDKDNWMPPPKNKANIAPLTKEQVGLIRAWIDQGAK